MHSRVNGELGRMCGNHSEVPMNWATEFADECKIWLSVNLGFPLRFNLYIES